MVENAAFSLKYIICGGFPYVETGLKFVGKVLHIFQHSTFVNRYQRSLLINRLNTFERQIIPSGVFQP